MRVFSNKTLPPACSTLNNNKYKSLHIGRFTNTPSLEVFSSYPTNAPQIVDFECSQNPC